MPDLNVPTVTQEHIDAFHRKHFSPEAVDAFFGRFRQHAQQQPPSTDVNHHENEEEDDGLGYYPDGAKRTLTDEQIAIFRHSEEEALRRVERKKLEEAKKRLEEKLLSGFNEASNGDAVEEENVEMEEGVIEEEVKEAKSIGRVDPASGKTFMWPAISSE